MAEPVGQVLTGSERETLELGRRLGLALNGGAVVLLVGPLGAGKTVLARGIAEGLGVTEPVSSPSFVLVRQYDAAGGIKVYHWDAYRLQGPRDLEYLPLEEHMAEDSVLLIEWGERLEEVLPADAIRIQLVRPCPVRPSERLIKVWTDDARRQKLGEALNQ